MLRAFLVGEVSCWSGMEEFWRTERKGRGGAPETFFTKGQKMNKKLEDMLIDFWYKPDPAKGASIDDINNAERRIRFKFPSEYRQLLLLRDGGISNYLNFDDILISPFRGVTGKVVPENLVDLYLSGPVADALPPKVVIFAADADAWFGLDYRENSDCPSVLHWSEYEDEPITLASSFREFLEHLTKRGPAYQGYRFDKKAES